MRPFLGIAGIGLLTAIASGSVCLYLAYVTRQVLRHELECTLVRPGIKIENRSLGEVCQNLESVIRHQRQTQVQFVFIPDSLSEEMPASVTTLDGSAFFALSALEYSYGCVIEIGERSIFVKKQK